MAFISCSLESDTEAFRSSDEAYNQLLIEKLKNLKVEHTIDHEGYIKYTTADKEKFNEAKEQADRITYKGSSIRPNNKNELKIFVNLLMSKELEHYIQPKQDGTWVKWYPTDEEHQKEIMLQFVNAVFDQKMNNINGCNNPCGNKTSNK